VIDVEPRRAGARVTLVPAMLRGGRDEGGAEPSLASNRWMRCRHGRVDGGCGDGRGGQRGGIVLVMRVTAMPDGRGERGGGGDDG
jgi:hypothetical protein